MDDRAYSDSLIDRMFRMNNKVYTVWDIYGFDGVTGLPVYQCRRFDGDGTVYLSREDIEPHLIQSMGV